jgi:hypothetical protein
MSVMRKSLLLLLATFALASCGGGGSGSNSVFSPPGTDTELTLMPSTTTLPASPFTVGQEETAPFPGNFLGSPYISEVTVSWRHKNGDFVTGTSNVNVAVSPTTTLSYSTLDSTSSGTTSTDDFHNLLGSGSVAVTAGTGTIYVHAGQTPGTGTLIVSAVDPVSNQNISAQLTITVAGASSGVPASISISAAGGVYIASSGGPQSTVVSATVTDGSGALVTAPTGVSNVQFQIIGPAGTDATLVGVDGAGNTHTGTTVNTASHNGIAAVTFQAGSQQGAVQVQATADRGDNNVDNGISNPVSATTTVAVSDGKLDSLTLSFNGSSAPSILINRVSTAATLSDQGSGTTTTIPPDPDATYSLTVTVQGTDREGNPVLPNTQIQFGSIDTPIATDGFFAISGTHGDPQPGGTNFTATDGQFLTAGGGAGPGDTLLVIGKQEEGAPAGNDDLESAARVTAVLSQTQLTVATPFNLNDTTGVSVNSGPTLPYIVGRAQIGNITSPAFTNANGRATTTLNYPVSKLGHITAIWAQGTGTDSVTGTTKIVTDIAVIGFPGVAPGQLVVSPNPIPGNITLPVQACVEDALGSPIQGVQLTFAFSGLVGTGTVDGIANGGTVPDLTDSTGCVTTTVTTSGVGSSGTPTLTFTGAGIPAVVPIVASGDLVLFAVPTQLGGDGGLVTLTLLNGNGTPVAGAQLTGTCTNAGIGGPIPVTNASGETTAAVVAALNIPNSPGTGSCVFSTASGSPTATVNIVGTDPCTSGISPTPPSCTGSNPSTVTIKIIASTAVSISSNPSGLGCSLGAAGGTQTCVKTVTGATYNLTSTVGGTWSGDCSTSAANKATLAVPATGATLACTLTAP